MKYKVLRAFSGHYQDESGEKKRIIASKHQVIDLPPDGRGHDFERAGLVERFRANSKSKGASNGK